MKWYFTVTDCDPGILQQVQVAVNSSAKNTTLEPNCVFHGKPNIVTDWLDKKGVPITYVEPWYVGELEKNLERNRFILDTVNAPFALTDSFYKSAYLRTELPKHVTDEFVVYTDIDVVFLKEMPFESIKPKYFAACSENSHQQMNTGVMVINVEQMRSTFEEFKRFILFKNFIFRFGDQGAYSEFYRDQWTQISKSFNWIVAKPSSVYTKDVGILHFAGMKPDGLEKLINDDLSPLAGFSESLRETFHRNVKDRKEILLACIDLWRAYR